MGGNSSGVSYGSERGNKALIRHTLPAIKFLYNVSPVIVGILNILWITFLMSVWMILVSKMYPNGIQLHKQASLF